VLNPGILKPCLLDTNPAVYPVAKARKKGSLPGRSGTTQDCREGMEGLDPKP